MKIILNNRPVEIPQDSISISDLMQRERKEGKVAPAGCACGGVCPCLQAIRAGNRLVLGMDHKRVFVP